MANSFYATGSQIGVDLNNSGSTQLFALGTHFLGSNDTEWVYVQANTSINGLTAVAYNATFTAGMASGGDLTTLGNKFGTAQTSISSQAFGWICVRGLGLTIQQTGTSSTLGVVCLAASGVPTGVLSNQITASNTLAGISLVATATATYGTFNLTWPRGYAAGE